MEPVDMDILKLKAIAEDKSVPVPEGMMDDISAGIDTLAFLQEKPASRTRFASIAASVAAAVAVLLGVGLGIGHDSRMPEDTFTDPYLAYAQLEETFALISSKMDKGLSMAQEAGTVLARTNEIMEKIN